jgi:hypothetical protein
LPNWKKTIPSCSPGVFIIKNKSLFLDAMTDNQNELPAEQSHPVVPDNAESKNLAPEPSQPLAQPEPQTSNSKLQTSPMDVHHHGHVNSKKRWLEYLFQFFMLFLAVFCGFLAEYQLEHKIEKDREKTFIKSFYEDLADDERRLKQLVTSAGIQFRAADTLQMQLPHADMKTNATSIYVNFRRLFRQLGINLYLNDRTIVQLRNSGGMRLIQNKQVSDSIVAYYNAAQRIQFLYDIMLGYRKSLKEAALPLLDAAYYYRVIDSTDRIIYPADTFFLRTADRNAINNCLLYISDIEGLYSALRRSIEGMITKAANIKKFIAEQYDIDEQVRDTLNIVKSPG